MQQNAWLGQLTYYPKDGCVENQIAHFDGNRESVEINTYSEAWFKTGNNIYDGPLGIYICRFD